MENCQLQLPLNEIFYFRLLQILILSKEKIHLGEIYYFHIKFNILHLFLVLVYESVGYKQLRR